MSRIDLLRQTNLFADLPDEILQALADSPGKRTFAKGIVLFHKGSPDQRLYLVETGLVRIFVLSDTGHEITLNIHGSGECFGELALLDGGPRSAGAVAMETLVAYTLDREAFLDLVEAHPQLARRALELVSERLRHLTAHVESLSFLDISGRVASCLLDFAAHHGQLSALGGIDPHALSRPHPVRSHRVGAVVGRPWHRLPLPERHGGAQQQRPAHRHDAALRRALP